MTHSQVSYYENFINEIDNWEGNNSIFIKDYVLKLKPLTTDELIRTELFLVMRTSINFENPKEYQLTIHKKIESNKCKIFLIFEQPITLSIGMQYNELIKRNPNISFEEAAKEINIRKDTIIVDQNFKYYDLINEVSKYEYPIIYETKIYPKTRNMQIYIQNISNVLYGKFPFGLSEYRFTEWSKRLFLAMIDYFKEDNSNKDQ